MDTSAKRRRRWTIEIKRKIADLYCPGYNPRQALAKDSKLAATALRYKIDTGKLAAEVRTEPLKKKKEKGISAKPVASRQRKSKG